MCPTPTLERVLMTAKPKKTWMGHEKDGIETHEIRWEKFRRWHQKFDMYLHSGQNDIKRMELIAYDESGKPHTVYEATAPPDFDLELKRRQISGNFRPNPRKEKLGELQFKDNIALKLFCYHNKPLNEEKTFRRSSTGLTLVVDGGAHRIQLGLHFAKAKELIKMLRRGIYRLHRTPLHPRFAYVVRSVYTNEDDSLARASEKPSETAGK